MNDPEDPNIYAAPEARVERPVESELLDLRFMAVWERRRLTYNAVLVAEVAVVALIIGGGRWLGDVEFWELLVVGAFGANVCFCAGPVGEAYLRWFGLKG